MAQIQTFPIVRRGSQVTLRILMLIRWLGITGQMTALILAQFWLKYSLPYVAAYMTVGMSVLLNSFATSVALTSHSGARAIPPSGMTAGYLLFDICQIALLLHFTGGIENPFTLMLLLPLALGALLLRGFETLVLMLATIGAVWLQAGIHHPLPWTPMAQPAAIIRKCVGLSVAALGLTAYIWFVAREKNRILDALAASMAALTRERELSALGTLAAAAAHELGTPLSTISVIASELAADLPEDSPIAEDVALLQSQAARCRDILAALVLRPNDSSNEYQPIIEAPFSLILREIAEPYLRPPIVFDVAVDQPPAGIETVAPPPDPMTARSPELMHGLGNFIHNALQFANSRVVVTISREPKNVFCVRIGDDGPGFARDLLARLGEPYLSTRSELEGHMGLGIFIAETLLERTGAKVYYDNRAKGGAEITIRWPGGTVQSATVRPKPAAAVGA